MLASTPADDFTSADQSAIVRVEDLRKTYRSGWFGSRRLPALQGVSLEVHAGEVFGLLGPNGAGKTTLIKTLLGIIRKSSGSATIFGHPVGTSRSRARIGYLPENLRVEKHHTARSALHLYGRLSRMSSEQIRRRTDQLLAKVGLQGRDRETVRRFSKGMYQRLGLAQALMHDPDLLILDEPTDGLDPVGRSEMRELLQQLRSEGKTIFLNSHILQEVEAVCDRVAVLAGGTLRGLGSIEELTAHSGQQRFQMQVLADPQTALAALPADLAEHAHAEPQDVAAAATACRLVVLCSEDAQIDASVDALRAAGLSIRSLQLQTLSLEDAFFEMVGNAAEELR
ncbi:ABC transporter ATP-binding protein [Roseimaritima ulvae]|uniref:Putative ABC transporter ATP-binding protein YxlF n=1 Tax=Roseimaritima ulvae TaxID=980254 RepID=A0A5B9QUC9_9BACT|nr:ABC transporter ATP-binding protein [Roseimaritima ulvae]QEG42657.1 putative ABC transporter ATP-binding protein YxlF [Roseimaritima ulvae]